METPVPNHIEIKIPNLETIIVRGFYESDESLLYVTIPGNIIQGHKDTLVGIVAEMDAEQEKAGFRPKHMSEFYAEASAETIDSLCIEDGFDPEVMPEDYVPNSHSRLCFAIAAVKGERFRQDAKWGKQSHLPVVWATILSEESGELSKAALACRLSGDDTPETIVQFYTEAMHCAAVGVAILEDLEEAFPDACDAATEAARIKHQKSLLLVLA